MHIVAKLLRAMLHGIEMNGEFFLLEYIVTAYEVIFCLKREGLLLNVFFEI